MTENAKISRNTVLLFTRFGLGHAPQELQSALAVKYLSLTIESGDLPARIIFYTEGVKLACEGSAVLEQLKSLEASGVELVLCSTCLEFLGLADKVRVGVVGGMGDILDSLQKAAKVLSL